MWGLSLYCCDSHRCYTAEQRLMTLGNQSCSQLPAGQTRKRGLLPRSGGMSSPFGRGSSQFGRRRWRRRWRRWWRQPTSPWEEPFLQTAAIRQAKTVTFLYCGSLKFTSEIKKTTYIGDYNLETSWNMRTGIFKVLNYWPSMSQYWLDIVSITHTCPIGMMRRFLKPVCWTR